jgi:hypothetical protein
MEAIINQPEKKKQRVSIKDAKEIMDYIHDIQGILFERQEEFGSGVYLELMDKLLEMSGGEFYMELEELAARPLPRERRVRIRPDNMRKYVRDNPHKACLCPRCDTPLMKKSLAAHLKCGKCKDTAYLVKGTGGVIEDPEDINNKVITHYDNNTELEEVELTGENYFWANMFASDF